MYGINACIREESLHYMNITLLNKQLNAHSCTCKVYIRNSQEFFKTSKFTKIQ